MKAFSKISVICTIVFISFFAANLGKATSSLTPITILLGDDAVATGAINAIGNYDMPVIQHGNSVAIQCTVTCVFPAGTLTIRLNCEFGSVHGQWQILSGTGDYQGMRGNGSLTMDDIAETLTGNIIK